MRVETTIALPKELWAAIDERSQDFGGRSRLVEAAVRTFLGPAPETDFDARDREIIDRFAEELNREAEDALEYQVPL